MMQVPEGPENGTIEKLTERKDDEKMGVLSGLEPQSVFYYFEEMTKIPHGSGNVDRISDYLVEFARERNLFCIQDECKNVIIVKEATNGYEKEPAVILQGHMDMVAVKKPDCDIDMKTEGLRVAVDGDKIVYTSPVYAGGILNDDVCESEIEFALLRSGAFKKAEPDEAKAGEVIAEAIVCPADAIKTKITDVVKEISETVNLEEADIIVAGGRGVGSAENFSILKELADALGGVIGATRAPIEAGWISRAYQIGQSGKSVAPKLYIACGISGATQHVAGITGADYIVAINKDEDAAIFDIANVGIVGNLHEVVPVLTAEVKKLKG